MPEPQPVAAPQVDNTEELFRGVKKSQLKWNFESNTVQVQLTAFMRRPIPLDSSGLSVYREVGCTINAITSPQFPTFRGLMAALIRGMGLDIVPKESLPGANVTGLPHPHSYHPEDPLYLQTLDRAKQLKESSHQVHDLPAELVEFIRKRDLAE